MTTAKMPFINNRHVDNQRKSIPLYQVRPKALDIKSILDHAAQAIAPVWPLETFIATNPLQGYESLPFEQALLQSGLEQTKTRSNPALEAVNAQMIKWCAAYFDEGQSSIDMPYRDRGLYLGFLKLAPYDKQLHLNKKESLDFLNQLPKSADEAIKLCLAKLQIPMGQEEKFVTETLSYLPGWAGYVKWNAEWKHKDLTNPNTVTLSEFLAVRLVMTVLLWPEAAKVKKEAKSPSQLGRVIAQIKKNEANYQQTLLHKLLPQLNQCEIKTRRPDAQLVFCIDVRSEPFRRAIESMGDYETLGFAGFFGIPVHVREFETNKTKACCPVLLKPRFNVREQPIAAHQRLIQRYRQGSALIGNYKNLYHQMKHNFSTPFALVESLGLWYGFGMLLKSLSPRLFKTMTNAIKHRVAPPLATELSYDLNDAELANGMSLDDQISYAETVLRLMGLTSGFAKLIILCGHGAATENNPYASALDCGACGGNHGRYNAQLLASILNKSEVRLGLEDRGMHIPLDTEFYGALHNTTTDQLTLHTASNPQPIYPDLLKQLENDLNNAMMKTNQERGLQFNSAQSAKDSSRRSMDWSETRPEWGLARNAAFIVAPRQFTKNIDLDGRCFLHSYQWEHDNEGALLETILTAPMVVAEWINTQYLFSTLDNVAFGSGSKITHNVVGKIGVMQGNGSDLMHGLPLQSVMSSDEKNYHLAQRLLTIVYAPKALVFAVIEKHSILQTLFFNEWVHLVVIDPCDQLPYQLDKSGQWFLKKD